MRKFIILCMAVMVVLPLVALVPACQPQAESAEEHYEQGNALLDSGQYEQAILEFTKAIELDPAYTKAYSERAYAYYQKGEYEKALSDCNKIIELGPENDFSASMSYYNRGLAYKSLGQKAEAIADFEKSIELNPSSAWEEQVRQEIEELQGQ